MCEEEGEIQELGPEELDGGRRGWRGITWMMVHSLFEGLNSFIYACQ